MYDGERMSRISKKSLLVGIVLISFIIYCTVYNQGIIEKSKSSIGEKYIQHVLHENIGDKLNALPDMESDITRNVTLKLTVGEVKEQSHLDFVNQVNTIKEQSLEDQTCQARTNIAFLKMHKCSSSTIQNILFRYGDERDLQFVLPMMGNYLGHDLFNKRYAMPYPAGMQGYNILCHHTRFSYKGMQEALPGDAAFVTIIRDPVTMYESIFTYSKYDAMYNVAQYDDPLGKFLENPEMYYNSSRAKDHAKDPMLYDLGLPIDQKKNQAKIDNMIMELSEQFDLVMITEYFDESLILFKELMCWTLEDIIYVVLNARAQQSVKEVSQENAIKIRKWNEGDVKLYNHFNKTFWLKIERFGTDRMTKEVAKFRQLLKYYEERCIDSVVQDDKKVWHPGGIKVESFRLKHEVIHDTTCVRLVRTELPYTDFLKHKRRRPMH